MEVDRSVASGGSQGADHAAPGPAEWVGAWIAPLALALWMQRLALPWLGIAAVGAGAWTFGIARRGRGSAWGVAAAAALWLAVGGGLLFQLRLREVANEWADVRFRVEERAAEALRDELNGLVDRGRAAVAGAAEIGGPRGRAFTRLEEIRERTEVSALAVFDSGGAPLVWTGEHRGTLPVGVRRARDFFAFDAGPLWSYLYFARPLDGGRTAVAAVLLDAGLDTEESAVPFVERFAERHGIIPRFATPERARGTSVWDWSSGGEPILSVTFATLTQEAWRERVAREGRRWVAGGVLAALLLLTAVHFQRRAGPPGIPIAVITAALLMAPLGEMLGSAELFSPLRFVLPLAGDVTLGELGIFLLGAAGWLLTRARSIPRVGWAGLALRAGIVALVLVGALWLIRSSAASGLLAGEEAGGTALQITAMLLIGVPLFALLRRPPETGPHRLGGWLAVAAILVPALLGLGVILWWSPARDVPLWVVGAWAIPWTLLAASLTGSRGEGRVFLVWIAVGWIGGTATLAHLWTWHLQARLEAAEAEIGRLGTVPDPFLDFSLRQFADRALFLAAEGQAGVELLYGSWVASGLAQEGYEARLTLWNQDAPVAELKLSDQQLPPEMMAGMLRAARAAEEPILERFTHLPSVHYLLLVPLPGGRTLSVAVPPRRQVERSTPLARLLDPGAADDSEGAVGVLSLMPGTETGEPPTEGFADRSDGMRWIPWEAGLRSEATVRFPGGPMHAHLVVPTPSRPLLVVRGLIRQAFGLGFLALLWIGARSLGGDPFGFPASGWRWVRTFRGRLTLSLFAFFLLPMLAFGALAYQTLSRETLRTAAALAARTLDQAVAADDPAEPVSALGERARADLLLYRNGVLVDAASPEVLDLGLYPSWLSPGVYLEFASGEGVAATEEHSLGGHEYLVSYRRVAPGRVLALPTPLASGDVARRQRELTDVVLLAGIIGAALSVVLALAVGRAFSRPIEGLSRAAAAVGAGNLRTRLPDRRQDEFGGLYRSFNRMVQRLRDAREALVRETRRTELIVAEAATGVLALDRVGRVALANPRAAQILGAPLRPGAPIPEGNPMLAEVARLVREFRSTDGSEGGAELELDGRVIRVRLRRLPASDGGGGAVLALDDITPEIRSARVLAWGEMARQVAHEIKNPLTPIKLSVQHIRRAHADERGDFEQILDRNVDAILREIDRLGEIARAFSRFGTPQATAGTLEWADAGALASETLSLYRGGHDGIEYRLAVDPGAPPAHLRRGEFKEVLVNLLENARAALDGTGAIRISVAPAGGEAWVSVDVHDTGEGIPPESLPRIFDPQFSTRSSGTGLGLAIVRRLVESWGGEVTAESEPGEGTTVHLRLRSRE